MRSLYVVLAAVLILSAVSALSSAVQWPQEFSTPEAQITIYQPQLESFEGNLLSARAAVSVKPAGSDEQVFGAIWIDAKVSTDTDERIVYLVSAEVTAAKFPEAEPEQLEWLAKVVEAEIEGWGLEMSLDQLIAALDLADKETAVAEHLNNDPPRIIYRTEPTTLVTIDGEPALEDVEKDIKAVVNTMFFIVYDTKSKTYYLRGGQFWYSTKDLEGEWRSIDAPPKNITDLAEKVNPMTEDEIKQAQAAMDSAGFSPSDVPDVIMAEEPSELVLSDGKPEYAPVEGTSLLYMTNCETDVLMNIDTQKYYVLLAGRWYMSGSLKDGTWTFVEPGDVPEEFARIPEDSDIAGVRASVPGTQESKEAVLENSIPQTAAVYRDSAGVEVKFDGDPEFTRCGDTQVYYAKNCDKAVLMIDKTYYCCDEAVWFVSSTPEGPWSLADEVPEEVSTIPPECPVYNVKYVYIYDSTPEVVYVGYTPGYTCSYVYGGVVVYGTGWHYPPWWRTYYYPRPATWGFGVHWNPYTGWGFNFGIAFGWVGWRWAWWGPHPWGPGGYRYGYRHGYYHGYHHGYRPGYRSGFYAGYRAGSYPRPTPYRGGANNIYKNKPATRPVTRPTTRPATTPSTRPVATPAARPGTTPGVSTMDRKPPSPGTANNVYADKSGNVYRKTDSGWQTRDKGNWSSVDRSSTTARQSYNKSSQDLNRQSQARNRGTERTQSYQTWQGSTRPSQPTTQQRPQQTPRQRPSGGGKRR
jgi:hypothetical protein